MRDVTLILNAAEGRVQILLLREEEILAVQDWSAPSRGTEVMAPLLADAFRRTGTAPAHLARIACVAGPGSFTGVRLALATAAALRRATGAPLAGLNYLRVLAAGLSPALACRADGAPLRLRVLTHARRGLVHGQDFLLRAPSVAGADDPMPEPAGEPAMLELAGACAPPLPHLLMGSGVTRNLAFLRENFPESRPRLLPRLGDQALPAALAALTLRLPESAWKREDVEPLYLRPCDAVDNLSSIAAKRGDDPMQAHGELERLLAQAPGI